MRAPVSAVDLDDWRAARRDIEDIGGVFFRAGSSGIDLTGRGEPRRLPAAFFSPGFFGALGVVPEAGRLPREEEMVRGGPDDVVVISHTFWVREFDASPDAIGTTLTLSGVPSIVVGVLPPSMRFPSDGIDVYLPYSTIPDYAIPRIRVVRTLDVVARAKTGVPQDAVETEMAVITRRLANRRAVCGRRGSGCRSAVWRGAVGADSQRLRNALVIAEIAVAMMLVVGAGLMTRSFVALLDVDPGFRQDGLVAVQFTIDSNRHDVPVDPARPGFAGYMNYYEAVIEKVRRLPGVESAAAVKDAPFRGTGEVNGFQIANRPVPAGEQAPTATVIHVSDDYFSTIGARLLAGRELASSGRAGAPPVVVVNGAFARQFFPSGAVGQHLQFGRAPVEIIGVVNDIRQVSLSEQARPTLYLSNYQNGRVQVISWRARAVPPSRSDRPSARRFGRSMPPSRSPTCSHSTTRPIWHWRGRACWWCCSAASAWSDCCLARWAFMASCPRSSTSGNAKSAYASRWGHSRETSSGWCCAEVSC